MGVCNHEGTVYYLRLYIKNSHPLKVHEHEFFLYFFCRNRDHMVPRACNTRFLKILFDSAEMFRVCSACEEIRSGYAQCAMKFVPRMLSMDCTVHVKTVHILPLAEHARKFVPCMLSVQCNWFSVCSACDKIVSVYAQHMHAIIFKKYSKYQIKMQVLTIKSKFSKTV